MSNNDLSVEELLSLLENSKKENKKAKKETSEKAQHIKDFVVASDIKAGEVKIPNEVIWHKYAQYQSRSKLGYTAFFREFAKFFKSGRFGKQRYYFLNNSAFDLSKEGLREARETKEIRKQEIQSRASQLKKRIQSKK